MTIRPAADHDVDAISQIIMHHAAEGLLLPRSKSAINASLPGYLVADDGGRILACGALHRYSGDLAEICGLATAPGVAGKGTGSAIVRALIEVARSHDLSKVFALTLVPQFFEKLGFRSIPHETLPQKIWKDCIACPKFGACNEIAVLMEIANEGTASLRLGIRVC